jgi:integrin beta 3
VVRLRGARSELRRQLREQKRVRAMAMATVVLLVLGAPMLYFGIQYATRDPVLTSLDRLEVPDWAAQDSEDRVASGSRWCFIDCRFRERTLQSEGETGETGEVYQAALRDAGWSLWEVEGCPQVAVEGDYTCWRRDEYTLDLWVHPPECAYDPLNLRPSLEAETAEEGEAAGEGNETGEDAGAGQEPDPADECGGSIVEIKMQNRVADERGLSGSSGEQPPPGGELPEPTGSPVPATPTPDPSSGEPDRDG